MPVGCGHGGRCSFVLYVGAISLWGTMAALGFFFVTLPCLAIVCFVCFAACRARRHKAFKISAYVFLSAGLLCALTPVGVLMWTSTYL